MTTTFFQEEHELFRRTLRELIARELAPHVDEWEAAGLFPREVFRRCGELGFLGAHYPEEVGGAGGDGLYAVVWGEELARIGAVGVATSLAVQTDMATPIIQALGTREQKAEFLTPALRGEKIAAIGITEPGCGSDVAALRTTARRDGGDLVINGAKCWITNGTRADFITLAVRTGGEGHKGISLVLFPTDVKGFTVTKKIKKVGQHASDTAELSFEDCRIPARNILGEENRGFTYIMKNFQSERLIVAVIGVASCDFALERTVQYTKDRSVFGRPVLGHQVWQHTFATLKTKVEAARWLTYRAADLHAHGEDATTEVTMAKLFACELVNEVADRCVQAHGGYGYSDEFPISRFWRDARAFNIGGGSSEVMREILAKRLGYAG